MIGPAPKPMNDLLEFLTSLEQGRIWYRLERVRDAVMVLVAVPGERWEVEFFSDGHVEVERFVSTGQIGDRALLLKLLAEYGEQH